jgi:DNA topoisomerase VI subunit A
MADALLTDAILIPQQIAQAESSESQAVRLKSASFINIMTRNILSYLNGLEKDGVKEKEYLNLLRQEIRSFRRTFKKWRKQLGYRGNGPSWGFNDYAGY